jgi:hypothetical protein
VVILQRVVVHHILAVATRQPSSLKPDVTWNQEFLSLDGNPRNYPPASIALNSHNKAPNDIQNTNPRHRAKGVNCRSED